MFKITIEETTTEKKICGKEWAPIDTTEVERDPALYGLTGDSPKTRVKEVFGYTPEIEKTVPVKRDILVQVVEKLDIAAVIKAINGIS